MPGISIQTTKRVIPMVYAYSTPEIARHDGHLKIGYTDRQTVEERVHQQGHTVDVIQKIEWKGSAIFDDGSGETFTDNDFRAYLYKLGYERIERTEYVKIPVPESRQRFYEYKSNRGVVEEGEFDTTPYTPLRRRIPQAGACRHHHLGYAGDRRGPRGHRHLSHGRGL